MVEIVFSTITCLKIKAVYAKIKSVRYRNKFINDKNITEGKMFDMNQVGANICKFRKSIGITQMDLADKLGISFQAVSNWERGISMPDISKLNELSVLFDISIDEILGNERACTVIKNLLNDKPTADISIEEIREIAPILHEDEVESLIEDKDGISIEEISKLAPFLSQEYIDKIAKEILKEKKKTKYWFVKKMEGGYQALSHLIDNETTGIHFDTLEKLCNVLECEPGDILVLKKRKEKLKK